MGSGWIVAAWANPFLARSTLKGLGESSPQARRDDLDGKVPLLGVSHADNTSLHLTEYRADWPEKPWTSHHSSRRHGHRRWVTNADLEEGSDEFHLIGDAFGLIGQERAGPVAAGLGRRSTARAIVDVGLQWMQTHRTATPPKATA